MVSFMIKSWYEKYQDFIFGEKMIILNKPYVSDFLVETIKNNNFRVLDNEIARNYFSPNELISTDMAKNGSLF